MFAVLDAPLYFLIKKRNKMKLIFAVILIIIHLVHIDGQITQIMPKYKATYSLKYQPDSTNANLKVNVKYYSFINDSLSYWVEENKFLQDSVMMGVKNGTILGDFVLANLGSMPKAKSYKKIVKNRNRNTIDFFDKIYVIDYYFKLNPNRLNWKILNIQDTINGYYCVKAKVYHKGRNFEAWYTQDIPISEGPEKFYGLPGMIVKIVDEKNHYDFNLIGFEVFDKPITIMDDNLGKLKTISVKEYKKAKESFYQDPIPEMESMGVVINEENKRKIRDKFKQRRKQNNNALELLDD